MSVRKNTIESDDYDLSQSQPSLRYVLLLTNPEKYGDNLSWTVTILPTYSGGEIPYEEGEPAEDEGSHHHSECHKGLVFFPPGGVHFLSFLES